jgi:hypothetical protein
MHFSENIFLLGGKWRPYGRHFALTAQKKSIKHISSFEFFSDKNIVFLFLMPQQTLDWASLGQYKHFLPT